MEEPLQGSVREAVFRGRVRVGGVVEGSVDVMMKLKSHVELCCLRSVLLLPVDDFTHYYLHRPFS